MSIYLTSVLSVSRKEKIDCEKMAEYLGKAGIITSVSSNISTQPHKEYGCRLTQSIKSKEGIIRMWSLLKKKYNFECAHLKVENKFSGCVLDYIEPTKCNILNI